MLGIFEIGIFAALAIWIILSNAGDLTLQTFDPTNAEAGTFNGIFKGMVFCILAFIGSESSAPLAEEARIRAATSRAPCSAPASQSVSSTSSARTPG